jgi:eukaryotic-like serine/threonine-protein kinase
MWNSPASPLAPVQPGDVLRGKYRVERLLGQGGMAYVVSAWHLHLEQRVAIKLLRPETASHGEVVERFLREARAASKLEGGHVTRVLDVDTLDGGAPFIVMEYLEGGDLGQILRDRAPLPVHEVAGWVRQACVGIAEAHGLGIIHRDLKPANLFLAQKRSGEAVVKVLDFGISKLLEDTRITRAAVGMGSAEYMSPEQMRSAGDVDARTDLWSLGVTLYELCTGATPFHAESIAQVGAAVLTRDPTPPRALRPDLPAGLEAVILRCLDKDPARRFAGAPALAAALAPFTTPAPSAPGPGVRVPPAQRAPPGFSAMAGVAVGVLAVAVVVVAFVAGRGSGGEASPAAAASRFQLDAGTLQDDETRLTWQRKPAPGAMDWASAKAYCARQSGGFRLPEVDELIGLLAVRATTPPLDPASFPTAAVDVFWSASAAGPGAAAVVHFSTGLRGTSVISERNRVRCVR